jgi:NAD-dependent SIR2 family protein deacetylase
MSGYSVQIEKLKSALATVDAIVVGAGAGLSTSAGLTYDGERFQKYFADFIAKYHFRDMYSAGFYPYATPDEHWAYWSRHIYYNRYEPPVGKPFLDLLTLLTGRNYFIVTTNVDHQFQLAGFDKKRLFYTQGDYGLWQCSVPCHQATYDNEATVHRMVAEQRDMRVPTELLPTCPKCGKPMTMNLRSDDKFAQDEGWHKAQRRYSEFLQTYANGSVLFLELGVGGNTPGIIKYPFWKMTYTLPSEKRFR